MARNRSIDGGALLQVLVSGALLNVSLASVLIGLERGNSLNQRQLNRVEAIAVAESLMDEIYMYFPDDTRLDPGTYSLQFSSDGNEVLSGGKYIAEWNISEDDPIPKMKKVDLTISWQEAGIQRSVSITSYRS